MGLKTFWEKVTNNGIDSELLGREVVKFRLLNQMLFIGFSTSALLIIAYLFTGGTIKIILGTSINVIVELIGFVILYFKRYEFGKYYACFFFPTVIAGQVIAHGGNIGEANIFTLIAFIALVIFDDKRFMQLLSVGYICTLYVTSQLYVLNNAEIEAVSGNSYDELITFPAMITAIGFILVLYQREQKKYEAEKQQFIKSLEEKTESYARLNDELSEVNNELEQFTYIASHDLKTPLRSLNNHVGLARRHMQQQQYQSLNDDLNFIEQGAKQMYALVNDILEYKSVYNNKARYIDLDLNNLIEVITNNQVEYLNNINGQIQAEDLPVLKVRKNDFTILFRNIINNGLKFNEAEQPTVKIKSEASEEYLFLHFEDNGIGIKPEFYDKIFRFFKKLHTSQKYQGTGIGLGLCRKIVNQYQGKIWVNSEPNEGATFTIQLPIKYLVKA